MTDVSVHIKSIITRPGDSNPEVVEAIYPGTMYCKERSDYILYDQVEEDFPEPVKHVIKITEATVNIKKKGLISSEMSFTQGTTHSSSYITPFGEMKLQILTRRVNVTTTSAGKDIEIIYDMEMNQAEKSHCEMTIKVKVV